MSKKFKTIMPCGTEITLNTYSHHLRNCEHCSGIWQDVFSGKYDDLLRQYINEKDLCPSTIISAIQDNLIYVPFGKKKELMKYVLNKKIYPEEFNHVCICGATFKKTANYGAHVLICDTYKKWKDEVFNKQILNIENLKKYLENNNMDIMEYLQLWNIDGYKNPAIYRSVLNKIDEFVKLGKLNYKKVSISKLGSKKKYVDKRQKTIKEKYGVENVSQLDWVKEKKRMTSLKNFGVSHWLESEEGKQRLYNSVMEKYGVENISQLEWVKQKKIKTFLEKYGVDNIFRLSNYIANSHKKKLLESDIMNMYSYIHDGSAYVVKKYNRSFIYFSDLEEQVVDYIYTLTSNGDLPKEFFNTMVVNEEALFDNIDSKNIKSWLVDISLLDKYVFELKKETRYSTSDILDMIHLSEVHNKKFIFYIYYPNQNLEISIIYFKDPIICYISNMTCVKLLNKVPFLRKFSFRKIKNKRKYQVLYETLKIIKEDIK